MPDQFHNWMLLVRHESQGATLAAVCSSPARSVVFPATYHTGPAPFVGIDSFEADTHGPKPAERST